MARPSETYSPVEPDPNLRTARLRAINQQVAPDEAPEPPNPINEYARKLLSPILPADFNPRAAPADQRRAATPSDIRGAIGSTVSFLEQSPLRGISDVFQNLPVIGGLNQALIRGPMEQGIADIRRVSETAPGSAEQREAIEEASLYAAIGALTGPTRVGRSKVTVPTTPPATPVTPAEAVRLAREVQAAPPPQPVANLGVNLEKLDTPQPVKDYVERVGTENAGFEAQRRGVISVEETLNAATRQEAIAETYAFLKPGTALNAEQITALKGAMVAKGEEVVGLQNKVRDAAQLGVKSDELTVRLILAATEHQSLQRAFAGVRAESGRALRIQRELTGALREGTGAAYDRAIAAIGGRERANLLVDRLQKIWTDPALDATQREAATYKFVQGLDSPKFFDKVNEFWINSILSSPTTHAVNVTGQTALAVMEMASKGVAAGVEAAITVGGKTRPRERFFSEALIGPFGFFAGLPQGFQRAGAMLRHGVTPELMTKFRETGEIAHRQAIGGVGGAVVNIPTKILGAEDQVFYATGYSRGLYERAANIAAREKQGILSGAFGRRVTELINNPTDEMTAYADLMGRRAGLRTAPGKLTTQILALRDIGKEFGPLGEFKPLRYVIPFVNTPTQLVSIGAEYSPLGLVKLVTSKGGERSDVLARSLLGSTGMAIITSKYAEGLITGAAPADAAQRDAFYAEGKLPYAVKIGDTWYSFSRLEPIATPLKWTALMMDALRDSPNQPIDATASKMAFAVAKALGDATYLSGFSALIDALNEPEIFAPRFVARIAGGFVPAAVRTGVQATDPYIRQPNGIIEQIEATLPFLNENVPPKLTAYGEPVTRSEGKQGISGVISPVEFNAAQVDPIAEKLASYRLPELIGPDGQPIPARNVQVGFVAKEIASYKLSREEGIRYQQLAGNATHNLLWDLFDDQRPYDGQSFSVLDEANQIRAIKKTIDDARVVGRAQVADEIMQGATDPPTISRAADMRLSTLTKNRDRAAYLEGLQAQGKLSAAVRSYVDAHKAKDEPTVSEYLRAAPLIREYLAKPPYIMGNPDEWARLDAARAHLAAETRALGYTSTSDEIRYDAMARLSESEQNLIFMYQSPKLRNKEREFMLRQYPFLSRFLSDTSTLQVP
jgi:hypothetical protein